MSDRLGDAMKLRVVRDWKRRWTFRPVRAIGGYVIENTYDMLRNGVVVGRVQREWGGHWSWRIFTDPPEYGDAGTMTEALHEARAALGLRQAAAP